MNATTLTHLAAREHINDLLREAEAGRRAAGVRQPYGVRRSLTRLFARRAASVAELEPAAIAAHRVVQVQHGN